MISIKGLNKFFNKGRQNEIHVINDITLDLPERGMTAIFGKSGCGKTTLLNVIGGLDGFASGSLTIEGKSIAKNTDEIRNKYVGYIFQNYNLSASESCFDNVADALRLCGMRDGEEIERRVTAALKNVGMEKYANRTPDTLSGGQQQRIAIARAIVKNPPVILADEPTGNLDEANTVMIMDLLREIAKDHLVLLVTHEQSLVDAYCDRIIELSDGKIISSREGRAEGVSRRGKQDIYLGELEKTELKTPEISLEYYGEKTEPLDIKIVNKDGRLYLKLGTERVHIIDGTGEVRLLDGVYQESEAREEKPFDMTALPSFEGEHYGRLFTLKSSLRSAYNRQRQNKRRGKKALRLVLLLFAAVTVLMSAVFGSSIGKILDGENLYNHNTFYVYTEEGDSAVFEAALSDPNSGIDHYTVYPYYPSGDRTVDFRFASFETFTQPGYSSGLRSHAVVLDENMAKDLPILAGNPELPSNEYILISDKVANDIIEGAGLGFVDEYSDLIGMTCTSLVAAGSKTLRVGGVVGSGEHAVYLDALTAARYANQSKGYVRVSLASDFGITLGAGEMIVTDSTGKSDRTPTVGSSLSVCGMELDVKKIISLAGGYVGWVRDKLSREEYFADRIPEGADPEEYVNEHYFEYDAYYYDQIDSFLREQYILDSYNFELWLYCVKGIPEVRDLYISAELCGAEKFRAQNGRFPTKAEFDAMSDEMFLPDWNSIEEYSNLYYREFESAYRPSLYGITALVSDEDYVKISKSYGKTDELFVSSNEPFVYTQIHSTDPALTEAYLMERFGAREIEYYESVITPEEVLSMVITYEEEEVVGYLVALVVILAVMSLCMYFIMRSSLMSRIKEIGIYRAIGVTRRNVTLRFGVEASLLAATTILPGYLLSGVFIRLLSYISPNADQVFFYPTWYALVVLIVLFGQTVLCGILPVLTLLRKTPSEIISKYDV